MEVKYFFHYTLQLYLNNYNFLRICEIWGNFLKHRYLANNFLINWVWILKFLFKYVTHIIVKNLRTANFVSIKIIFTQITISLPNFAFLEQNQLALLKDEFLKKILSKRLNTRRLFFTKIWAEKFFYWKQFQVFKIA